MKNLIFCFYYSSAVVFSEKLHLRYRELKKEAGNCVLLMQVGAFMHVVDEDAKQVSALTGLKLKMAGDVNALVAVGGFPKSGLDQYIGKLVRSIGIGVVAMNSRGDE